MTEPQRRVPGKTLADRLDAVGEHETADRMREIAAAEAFFGTSAPMLRRALNARSNVDPQAWSLKKVVQETMVLLYLEMKDHAK